MSKKSKSVVEINKPHIKRLPYSATSLTQTITPMIPVSKLPTVYYSTPAWLKMWKIIDLCQQEVGWLGLVDEINDGDYLITDIFLLEQEVTGGTTDIESDAVANLAVELESSGIDSTKLRYWGHSHVNMQVSPSGTDESQLADYMEHCEWFIRGIYNKKFEQKVDVFDKRHNVVFQKVDSKEHRPDFDDAWLQALKTEIATKVKQKSYSYGPGVRTSPTGGYYQPSYGHLAQKFHPQPAKPVKTAADYWIDEDDDLIGYDWNYSGGEEWRSLKK